MLTKPYCPIQNNPSISITSLFHSISIFECLYYNKHAIAIKNLPISHTNPPANHTPHVIRAWFFFFFLEWIRDGEKENDHNSRPQPWGLLLLHGCNSVQLLACPDPLLVSRLRRIIWLLLDDVRRPRPLSGGPLLARLIRRSWIDNGSKGGMLRPQRLQCKYSLFLLLIRWYACWVPVNWCWLVSKLRPRTRSPWRKKQLLRTSTLRKQHGCRKWETLVLR